MAMNSVPVQTFVPLLLLATLSAGLATAQSPNAPSPSAPAPSGSPGSPVSSCSAFADRCDWFFTGSGLGNPAPTFDLGSGKGDTAISPSIIYKDGQTVLAVNTNGGYTYTGPSGIPHESQNQFYGNGAYVYVRTFNSPLNVNDYNGRCFLLFLTEIELSDGSNLRPGDGNAAYLEARRCVVFATGGAQPGTDECWSPDNLEAQWDAYAALLRERLRIAILEDAARAPSNVTDCPAAAAALPEFLEAAAALSRLVSDCHVDVSLFVFGRKLLEEHNVEAALQAEILRDAAAGPPSRKLLGWGKRWLRKTKHALQAVKAYVVDPIADVTTDVVLPVIKAAACDTGCALVSSVYAGGTVTLCTADAADIHTAAACADSADSLVSYAGRCFSGCQ